MLDTPDVDDKDNAAQALLELAARHPFGPLLFLGQLAAFVRDRCPDPHEGLPRVVFHLNDGSSVDVCHVVGVGPRWVAIAAREPGAKGLMQTVLLPYEAIARVTIRGAADGKPALGFEQHHAPVILDDRSASAEEALRAAARPPAPRGDARMGDGAR